MGLLLFSISDKYLNVSVLMSNEANIFGVGSQLYVIV